MRGVWRGLRVCEGALTRRCPQQAVKELHEGAAIAQVRVLFGARVRGCGYFLCALQRLYVGEGGSKGLPKPAEAALADTELVTIKVRSLPVLRSASCALSGAVAQELVEAMEVNVGAMEVVSSSAKLLKKRIREASGRPHAVHGVHA